MADRKRELDSNQLAVWLSRVITQYGTALKIGGAVLGVLALAYLIFQLMAATERHRLAKSWEEYLVATGPEDYEKIINEYKGYRVELWAMLDLADTYYSEALGSFTYRRDEALTRIKQALELYQRAAREAERFPDIAQQVKSRALLGAAQCHESLGQRDKALELYRRLAEEFPNTWVAERAQQKIDQLSSPGAADFYAQLNKLQLAAPKADSSESLLPPVPGTEGNRSQGGEKSSPQPTRAGEERGQEPDQAEARQPKDRPQEKVPSKTSPSSQKKPDQPDAHGRRSATGDESQAEPEKKTGESQAGSQDQED